MVKILASLDFLLYLNQYNNKTIEEFDKVGKIDIESFLFFKQLISLKGKLSLTISKEKIENYKLSEIDTTNIEEADKINFIKNYKTNLIEEGDKMYQQIIDNDYSNISCLDIPDFFLLGNVSGEICTKIEAATGAFCFSLNRLKVPVGIRRVQLHKIDNTKDELERLVRSNSFNQLTIEDPYFLENYNTSKANLDFLSRYTQNNYINDYKLRELEVKIIWMKNDHKEKCLTEAKNMFETRYPVMKTSCIKQPRLHDRCIITNRFIMIIGNSLNRMSRTHLTIYPRSIYDEDYFNN